MSTVYSLLNRAFNKTLHARGIKVKDIRNGLKVRISLCEKEISDIRVQIESTNGIFISEEDIRKMFKSKINNIA